MTANKVGKKVAEKKTSTHPATSVMVFEAIRNLHQWNGSSLQAIKKYISTTHKVDVIKYGFFIRRALTNAVEAGKLSQSKGTGASGSFKLASTAPKKKLAKKPATTTKKSAVKKRTTKSTEEVKPKAAADKEVTESATAERKQTATKAAKTAKTNKAPTKPKSTKKAPTRPKSTKKAPTKPKSTKKAPPTKK